MIYANMKIALLCGGPSLERGISINSARSVLDHLESEDVEISPIYFDYQKKPYLLSRTQLYSNTPSDFDFKLKQTAKPLGKTELVKYLQGMDIAFPVMHGSFGEDGTIQQFLEKNKIPFVGTGSSSCKRAFDKHNANRFLKELDFFTLPSAVLKIYHKDHKQIIESFFAKHNIKRAVVKPATGGSSIGVFSVNSPSEALEKATLLFSKRMDTRVVIEEFASGTEFTVIILQNRFGLPVAILPTEIETDYTENQIFDFRKKYLPTRQVTYHCPPRFDENIIEKIQLQAEQLFSALGMRDFARFDGWVLPDGKIWFADFNPISGMEQNSFLFQQGSRVGLSHTGLLRYILRRACQRYGIKFPEKRNVEITKSKPVNILFGGKTSERQVSLMSGTNVWLKLRKSSDYDPKPFILDPHYNVWQLPYALTLNHTVEEIVANCEHAKVDQDRIARLEERAKERLSLSQGRDDLEPFFIPKKITLEEFVDKSKFVFIALHGGIGEDGTLQKLLETKGVSFNGTGSTSSGICINKAKTNSAINDMNEKGIYSISQQVINLDKLIFQERSIRALWQKLCKDLKSRTLIVKPVSDGCSSGIAHLYSAMELQRYLDITRLRVPAIPPQTFRNQKDEIELPIDPIKELLFEKFVNTDRVSVRNNQLAYKKKSGLIEITVGVIEENNQIKALNPSITIAEGEVLTVEEKFQGGTGVNITPPPEKIIESRVLNKIKRRIEKLSTALDIKGYARIDTFVDVKSGDLSVIEINTLPGLTPSTVIYHQALAEKEKLYPRDFLEKIIKNKGY